MSCRPASSRRRLLRLCAPGVLCGCLMLLSAEGFAQTSNGATKQAGIKAHLLERVRENPNDATAWRLLGKLHAKAGDQTTALEALQRSVSLDPLSVAAQHDLGQLLLATGDGKTAAIHFQQVIELAPESQYAIQAQAQLTTRPELAEIEQVGFEVKRFDQPEVVDAIKKQRERADAPDRPFSLSIESGVFYNSNVALAPISRELSPETSASMQAFIAPDFEYRVVDGDAWRAGPTFKGYFNLNEGNFREFNLQNYQPGLFMERVLDSHNVVIVPRLAYKFSHDEFDGSTLGNRHAVTTSATTLWNEQHYSVIYWAIDNTNFIDDGILPSVTSQDGWTNSVGFSHTREFPLRHLQAVTAGGNVERANLEGSDFSYNGVNLFTEVELPLCERLMLLLQAGWGYRDYFDFEFTPSRNEHIWTTRAELRRQLSDDCAVSAVFNFDRFDSENPLFEAERSLSGLLFRYDF